MFRRYRTRLPAATALAALALAGVIATTPALADEKAFSWTHDDADLEWVDCPPFMPEGCGLAVLQGHPAEPNADVFFRLPAGTTAPRHWHASAERMVPITGELDIGYDDQGIACPAPPAPGRLSRSSRSPLDRLAKPGAGCLSTWKPNSSV